MELTFTVEPIGVDESDDDFEEPVYNRGLTNDILITLDDGVSHVYALPREDGEIGTVAFDLCYDGCVDYMLEQQFGSFSHPVPAQGYLVVEDCEVDYTYDSYNCEHNAELYCGSSPRPARIHEILVDMKPITLVKSWRIILDQLCLALWFNFNRGHFE